MGVNTMSSVQPHKWDVVGFHKMVEAGVFPPDARLELLAGEIFDMTPMGNMHRWLVIELTQRFIDAFRGKALVLPQCSVILGPDAEPEPDFAILKPDNYKQKEPDSAAILLCSMEEEVRRILRSALQSEKKKNGFGSRLHRRFVEQTGGVELEIPPRSPPRTALDFGPDNS